MKEFPKKPRIPLACGTQTLSVWMSPSVVFPDTFGLPFFLVQYLQGAGIAPGHQHCPRAPTARSSRELPHSHWCLWRGRDEQTLSCLRSSRSCLSWRTNCTDSSAMTCCPVRSRRECWVWMLGDPVALSGLGSVGHRMCQLPYLSLSFLSPPPLSPPPFSIPFLSSSPFLSFALLSFSFLLPFPYFPFLPFPSPYLPFLSPFLSFFIFFFLFPFSPVVPALAHLAPGPCAGASGMRESPAHKVRVGRAVSG